jgi:hypothetical protein
VPGFEEALVPRDAPLSDLAKAAFHAYLALVKSLGQPIPEIAQETDLKGGEALDIVHETAGGLYPGLRQE